MTSKRNILGLIAIGLLLGLTQTADSAVVARCGPFVSGQTLTAAQVNCLDTRVLSEFNGSIDNANIKSAAGIAASKISGTAVTLAGTETLTNKTTSGPLGSSFSATTACAAGFTRVGLWCYDTDGVLDTTLFSVSGAAIGDTTVNNAALNTAKVATIRVLCSAGTAANIVSVQIRAVTVGNQVPSNPDTACIAAAASGDNGRDVNDVEIMLDGSGDFEYEVTLSSGGAGTLGAGYLAAYMD